MISDRALLSVGGFTAAIVIYVVSIVLRVFNIFIQYHKIFFFRWQKSMSILNTVPEVTQYFTFWSVIPFLIMPQDI